MEGVMRIEVSFEETLFGLGGGDFLFGKNSREHGYIPNGGYSASNPFALIIASLHSLEGV